MNPVARLRQSSRTPLLQAVKTAVAVAVAVLICRFVVPTAIFPTFAAIAALLVVQPSINQSFVRGLERSAGVVIGVILATLGRLLLGDAVWAVLLVIIIAIFVAWGLRLTPTSSTQVGISGMLVLTSGLATPDYAVDRIVETIIGAAVALVVNALIVPPVHLPQARLGVARLARDAAAAFERIAIGITERQDRDAWERDFVAARALRTAQAAADAAIEAARESLAFNPRSAKLRDALEAELAARARLSVIVTRVIGMTRAIRDNVTPDLFDDRTMDRIATEAARIAVDVRRVGAAMPAAGGADGGAARGLAADAGAAAALTAPVTVLQANPDHWILIGSLLEDIRRVRETLLGDDG